MLHMIDSYLDFYKIESGSYDLKPVPIDLVSIINELVEDLKTSTSHKNITIETLADSSPITPDQTITATGEEALCHSMLSNLMKNAVEASEPNNTIRVNLVDGGANVSIQICNPAEVPEDIKQRFFEKYVTHGKDKGTGLGTYSAKLLAEVQGGAVFMETSAASGTKLTVQMPKP